MLSKPIVITVVIIFSCLVCSFAMAGKGVPYYGCDEESHECFTPDDLSKTIFGQTGFYQSKKDYDDDHIRDRDDMCPHVFDSFRETIKYISDGGQYSNDQYSELDVDEDEIGDACDNCPYLENEEQHDMDADGIGNECDDDADGDLIVDRERRDIDAGPEPGDGGTEDAGPDDKDPKGFDNCIGVYNPSQSDLDKDHIGDACDDDIDGDGILNKSDPCPFGDEAQLSKEECAGDSDGDGIADFDISTLPVTAKDNCPTIANEDQEDMDKDSIGDACDIDMDEDGVENWDDNCYLPIEKIDFDSNPIKNWGKYTDTSNADQTDSDRDGIGDACDCNPNCFVVPELEDEYDPSEKQTNDGCDDNGLPIDGYCSKSDICLDPDCSFRVDSPNIIEMPLGDIRPLRLFANRKNALIRYEWSIIDGPAESAISLDSSGVTGLSTPYEYHYFDWYDQEYAFIPFFGAFKEGTYTLKLHAVQLSDDALTGKPGAIAEAEVIINVFGGMISSTDDCACQTVGSRPTCIYIIVIIGLIVFVFFRYRKKRQIF